jgi:hypothetical protein
MARHVLNSEDTKKASRRRSEIASAARLRRESELWLLDRLYAELAMPEWYPER